MNYGTLIHRAFHDPEGRGEYAGCNVSFYHNSYATNFSTSIYSYSTVVARVVEDINGNKITIISNAGYSNTTRKHLSCIRWASPYPVIYAPHCERADFVPTFREHFEYWIKDKDWRSSFDNIKHAEERRDFMHLINMFDTFQERIGGLDELLPLRNCQLITAYVTLCNELNNGTPRKVALAKAKVAYDAVEAEVQNLIAGGSVDNDMLAKCYGRLRNTLSYEEKEETYGLIDKLNSVHYNTQFDGSKRASYVFVEEDVIRTSQWVTASIEQVKRLLGMWKAHEQLIGQEVGIYKVVENQKDYVKIGCHVIPTWNVQMLYDKLIKA